MAAFDDLVTHINGAMVIVTAANGGDRDGCLVGFHCQCSIEPPRYAVWMSVLNHTTRLAAKATHVAVHVLAADDRHLAELFGGETGDDTDKLATVAWSAGPGGAPLLDLCPNRFVLEIDHVMDSDGDHVCIVGRPATAQMSAPGHPLRLTDTIDIRAGHPPDEAAPPNRS
jgi:flavin reductase (DIM6/NTAB) family NADH-FMN oxidoreductase RutF